MPPVPWENLSETQKQIIAFSKGSMLVLAGPGTGKTEVLTQRVAYLVKHGVQPEEILAITFTKQARNEMILRLKEFVDLENVDFNVSTLHATAVRLLGEYGLLRKYLAANDETAIILQDALEDLGENSSSSNVKKFFKWLDLQKANLKTCINCDEGVNKKIYKHYEELLEYNKVQDLSGIVLNAASLLNGIGDMFDPKIKHLLVDEYQDINHSEYELIKHLSKHDESTFFVGDDDQSIYGWRGADPSIIHKFQTDFKGGIIANLEESRRCTGFILQGAIEVVSKCKLHYVKALKPIKGDGNKIILLTSRNHQGEAIWILNKIREFRANKVPFNDIVIITKQENRAEELYGVLNRNGVRASYLRMNIIFKNPNVKKVISLFKLIKDREDNLALRQCLMNIKNYNIGSKGIKTLRNIAEDRHTPLWEIMKNGNIIGELGRWGASFYNFSEMLNDLDSELDGLALPDCVKKISEKLSIEIDPNLQSLIDFTKKMPDDSEISDFIKEFNNKTGVDFGSPDLEAEDDTIKIMTMHASKGLGFKKVFVIGFEDKFFPNNEQDLDEQRRLCYVSMTRAKEELYLCFSVNIVGPVAQGFKVYRPSPFLLEIPEKCRDIIQN